MAQEYGEDLKAIHTLDNGKMEKLMVMGSIRGQTEIDMKDSL